MRTVLFVVLWIVLAGSVGAQDEVYMTEDGKYVVVRKEERSSGRGWVRLGVIALLLAFGGGAAVVSQRKLTRPKNRPRPGSATTGTGPRTGARKPVRPTFNKTRNR